MADKSIDNLRLTASEEQVMLKLWLLEKATVAEILALYADPKPAYNTVSTIVRILEKKKFIRHKPKGRGYVYYPKISKEEYKASIATHLLINYFDNRPEEIMSYYNRKKSLKDLLG